MDKCTKVAILWFSFVALAVPQFGNRLLLFCYHSIRLFIMHQKILLLCYLSSRIFSIWNILLFCYSATLLPQWQNVSHLWNILLFCYSAILLLCYLSGRIFLICEILLFCYCTTSVAEFFSSAKYSVTLLPQWQNFSHPWNIAILLLCYLSGRILLICGILLFCYCATSVAEFFSILLFCSHLNSSRKPSLVPRPWVHGYRKPCPESWKPFSC